MQFVLIQILRALAALSVVFQHAQDFIGIPLGQRGGSFSYSSLFPWPAGVDLFFVISGFIMVYSSESLFGKPGSARAFLWRRISRIVPLYWAATSYLLIKETIKGGPGLDLTSVLTSFLFVPHNSLGTVVPKPILELGWTLNYEMFFYVVFAIAIHKSREHAVGIVSGALLVLAACSPFISSSNAALFVWSRPITIEFIFGMAIALLARRGVILATPWRLSLCLLGTVALFCDFLDSNAHQFDWWIMRVAAWGLPAALIVAGAVLGGALRREGWLTRAGTSMGDASYALYLCHPFVMSAFSALWFALKLHQVMSPWIAVAACVTISSPVAIFIHRRFELPLTDYLKSGKIFIMKSNGSESQLIKSKV
jgi:exopolysaccharide production protein ExoZ